MNSFVSFDKKLNLYKMSAFVILQFSLHSYKLNCFCWYLIALKLRYFVSYVRNFDLQ